MIDLIDIEKGKKKAKARLFKNLALVLIVAILTFAIDVILLFLSHYNSYFWFLLANIILTSISSIFVLFYVLNVFPMLFHYRNLYRDMTLSSMEKRRYLSFQEEKEPKIRDGVKYRSLSFSFKEGDRKFTENLYVLDNDDVVFEKDKEYRIVVFRNIILKYEGLEYAKAN